MHFELKADVATWCRTETEAEAHINIKQVTTEMKRKASSSYIASRKQQAPNTVGSVAWNLFVYSMPSGTIVAKNKICSMPMAMVKYVAPVSLVLAR